MTATTPTAFDPKPRALNSIDMIAGEAILAGSIVGFAASGASWTVVNSTSSTGAPLGVALFSQPTVGGHVTVATVGSVVKVELSTDNGTADAGDYIGLSSVAGMGIVHIGDIGTHGAEAAGIFPVGIALEDISAGSATVGGKGYILITLGALWVASS